MLTIVEKVIFLQGVNIFSETTTENLGYIASITEEKFFEANETISFENEYADSMFILISGKVLLTRSGKTITEVGKLEAIGTWSLLDDELTVATAKALEKTHVLKISKEDFYELLSDHIEITQGILKSLVKRVRKLLPN